MATRHRQVFDRPRCVAYTKGGGDINMHQGAVYCYKDSANAIKELRFKINSVIHGPIIRNSLEASVQSPEIREINKIKITICGNLCCLCYQCFIQLTRLESAGGPT